MRRVRFPLSTVAAMLVLAGLLAACGGSEEPEPAPDSSEPTKTQAAEPELWPFTGLPAEEGETIALDHPAYVAKVENNSLAVPQAGIDQADLIVEELVEGNTTRLAAFFYSRLPKEVGPIRSMRASDIGIVPEKDATVVTSGAAPITIRRIQAAGIPFVGEGASGVYRSTSRSAPHNLMADLVEVSQHARKGPFEPEPYLEWGAASDLPTGVKASRLTADFGNQATQWAFQDGGYVNTNSYAGKPFPADTVLVLRVQIGDAGYKDPAGNFVPETKFTGTGPALLFHGGRLVRGAWHKDDLRAPLTLTTVKGDDLSVPAGHVWIELVPAESGDVTWTK